MAEPRPAATVTVQLVRAPDAPARRTTRIGIGLLVSLVAGWPALTAAVAGDGFEGAVIRFLVTVALSVGGVLLIGSLYDRFTAEDPTADGDAAGTTTPATDRPVGQEHPS